MSLKTEILRYNIVKLEEFFMIEKLINWDKETLLCLNFDGGAFLDAIMWYFSWIGSFFILVIIFLTLMGWKRGANYKHLIVLFFMLGFVVLFCDQTANYFKDTFQKLRPLHNEELKALIYTTKSNILATGLYGTVSGHAANGFGIAAFIALVYKQRWFSWFVLSYAVLIAYSRVYYAAHYPFDVIFGALFGMLYAYIVYLLYSKVILKRIKL